MRSWELEHAARAAKTFTQAQIDAAVAAVNQLPAKKNDPDVLASFWPTPKNPKTLADIDFRDVTTASVSLDDNVRASNDTLSRKKLIWHVQHPGESQDPSVFTTMPIFIQGKQGKMHIADGQHRLAAAVLLGQTSWKSYVVPVRSN